MEINIDDYISEEQKSEIAREQFRDAVRQKVNVDFERMLTNSAYILVQQEVDKAFNGDMITYVRDNAIKVINNLSSSTVFSPPNSWDRGESKGWTYLNTAIEDHKQAISDKVLEVIHGIDEEMLRDRMAEFIQEAILNKLKG